jgi:hypothetical protein
MGVRYASVPSAHHNEVIVLFLTGGQNASGANSATAERKVHIHIA